VKPAGYIFNTRDGPVGEAGLYYDYLAAENGVFIRAGNPLLRATVLISPAEIRGLSPLEERVELPHGKIPRYLYDLALASFIANSDREQYMAVTWEDRYHLRLPAQTRETSSVRYEQLPRVILDIHSHGYMRAFFSGTDDGDEQGLRLYMVVGRLDTLLPEVDIRVGVYGYFAPLTFEEVFDV